MNYGRAFSFVTEDPDWIKKVIIAALVTLIPVVGLFAFMGWSLEINRRVSSGETELLPEWDNFGGFIMNGLKQFVVVLVYMLPAILIYVCGFGASFGLTAAAGSGDASSADVIGSIAVGAMFCSYCLLLIFLIVGGLLVTPASSVLAETGQIGAALRFGYIFGLLRAAVGPYILTMLIAGIASSVASSIGSIACGVGAFLGAAYVAAVSSHLHGQAYKIAKGTVGDGSTPTAM